MANGVLEAVWPLCLLLRRNIILGSVMVNESGNQVGVCESWEKIRDVDGADLLGPKCQGD